MENGIKVKRSGAAALKPTEVAVEQIAGRKKSKFWVYAIEPIPGDTAMDIDHSSNEADIGDGTKPELDTTNGNLPFESPSEDRQA